MLRLFIIITLLLFQDVDDRIPWNISYSLKWSDYKCIPENNAPHSASSQCGFNVEYETRTDSLLIIALAYFDKSKSWVKTKEKNDVLLLHEQGHFNIAELFARKLRCELKNASLGKSNYEEVIQSVFQTTMISYRLYQDQYDIATSFSNNVNAQNEWNIQINENLEAYLDCQNVSFLVPLTE